MQHELNTEARIELASQLARLRAAYDLLSDVWNRSCPREIRAAVGQDRMRPMMQMLYDQLNAAGKALWPHQLNAAGKALWPHDNDNEGDDEGTK